MVCGLRGVFEAPCVSLIERFTRTRRRFPLFALSSANVRGRLEPAGRKWAGTLGEFPRRLKNHWTSQIGENCQSLSNSFKASLSMREEQGGGRHRGRESDWTERWANYSLEYRGCTDLWGQVSLSRTPSSWIQLEAFIPFGCKREQAEGLVKPWAEWDMGKSWCNCVRKVIMCIVYIYWIKSIFYG